MTKNWINLPDSSESQRLEGEVARRVTAKVEAGEYNTEDIRYVSKLARPLVANQVSLSDERLEMLRRVCQLWDINFRATDITSHRPVIGPVIVAIKRALMPILKILMRDVINQQRDFNAAAVILLAEISQSEISQSEIK